MPRCLLITILVLLGWAGSAVAEEQTAGFRIEPQALVLEGVKSGLTISVLDAGGAVDASFVGSVTLDGAAGV